MAKERSNFSFEEIVNTANAAGMDPKFLLLGIQQGENAERIHNKNETMMGVLKTWNTLLEDPEALTDLSEHNILFAAGGGLVKQFGNPESKIWQAIKSASHKNVTIELASISFFIKELAEMGDFYRFLEGYDLHCIDERLVDDLNYVGHEVHCSCGACAAISQATNLDNVEDVLLDELGQSIKQPIFDDMPEHNSMVISIDLNGARTVIGEKRDELKEANSLAFNASIPLEKISEWAQGNSQKAKDLISTLVLWNVQIARNIIGGDHNELQKMADKTIFVVNTQGVEDHPLLSDAMNKIKNVHHYMRIEIPKQS